MTVAALLLLMLDAGAATPVTDFGIRVVGAQVPQRATRSVPLQPASTTAFNLHEAAAVARQFGRVTSMARSPARNRRVGGVPNSWHLSGRAIDVVRSPTVSHAALAGELRRRGYRLIESLDEGDHSHFAFAEGASRLGGRSKVDQLAEVRREAEYFRFVEMPMSRADRKSVLR